MSSTNKMENKTVIALKAEAKQEDCEDTQSLKRMS